MAVPWLSSATGKAAQRASTKFSLAGTAGHPNVLPTYANRSRPTYLGGMAVRWLLRFDSAPAYLWAVQGVAKRADLERSKTACPPRTPGHRYYCESATGVVQWRVALESWWSLRPLASSHLVRACFSCASGLLLRRLLQMLPFLASLVDLLGCLSERLRLDELAGPGLPAPPALCRPLSSLPPGATTKPHGNIQCAAHMEKGDGGSDVHCIWLRRTLEPCLICCCCCCCCRPWTSLFQFMPVVARVRVQPRPFACRPPRPATTSAMPAMTGTPAFPFASAFCMHDKSSIRTLFHSRPPLVAPTCGGPARMAPWAAKRYLDQIFPWLANSGRSPTIPDDNIHAWLQPHHWYY
ncbi:serine threonine-kinase sck1 [Cordyceps militaris]|uniref:Serine threonine-kinase sck1 n=1 Tax=Cordyceps militaris TaxID=73501 RepID=A0A2H4S6I4_CORMI|nr:serine threonine-kinase sck1 [Cordyceps militaris]